MAKRIKLPGRAESVEVGGVVAGANTIYDDAKGKMQDVVNSEVDAELVRLEEAKQDNLTFDNAPTEGSQKPVTSGGVYTADKALSDAIEAILLLIPSAASALNQLADKKFVQDSVATSTATFRGTYNVVSDLHLSTNASHAQIEAALDALSLGADTNDYCFVQVPDNESTENIKKTERYKFNGSEWAYEYDLNNSGFTAAQWEAINSNITALLVTKLSQLPTNEVLTALLAAKQDNLTFDDEPTAGSINPVTSGGIYTRNNEIVAMITALEAAKQDKLTFDSAPVNGSENPVTSGGVYDAIYLVQVALAGLDGRMLSAEHSIEVLTENVGTLRTLYQALSQSDIIIGEKPTTGVANIIYRVPGSSTFADWMYYNGAWVKLAEYTTLDGYLYKGIATPTDSPVASAIKMFYFALIAGTYTNFGNLVVTEGISILKYDGANWTQDKLYYGDGGVFDISKYNLTNGQPTPYPDLEAALGTNGANVPEPLRKGGMSVKFIQGTVQSSDNKYVQYRLKKLSWSADIHDWQCTNGEIVTSEVLTVTAGSQHGSTSDELYIDIPEGEQFAAFVESLGGKLERVELFVNYSDGTRESVYNASPSYYIPLTASKNIVKLGIYWGGGAAVTSGDIIFGVHLNSLFDLATSLDNITKETKTKEDYMQQEIDESDALFIKVNSGDVSNDELAMIKVVKTIRISGVESGRNYCIREITRARNGGYEFILAYINQQGTPTDIMTKKILSEDVIENSGITPMLFENGNIKCEVAIDYSQINEGGIINLFGASLKYAINPVFIEKKDNNVVKISAVLGQEHPSRSDELIISISSGTKYVLYIENDTGKLTGSGFQIYATYKDGTREMVYIGAVDSYILLTASKDIVKFGIYWNNTSVLAAGYIYFSANYNKGFISTIKHLNDVDGQLEDVERNKSFIKAVDGVADANELLMLRVIKDIKLIGSWPQNEMLSVRELSRNRNNIYETVICKVANDGSITDKCTLSVPASSVIESTPVTQIIFYHENYGYVQLRADFSLISDGGIINRYGQNTKYVIRFDRVIELPTATKYESCRYYPNNILVYDTDSSLVTLRTFTPSTESIEHKYKGQVTPEKRYMCIGFDDFRESDFNTIMPLFDKYGFKASFHQPIYNETLSNDEKKHLSNVVSGRHELGNHAWKHYQYPYTEPMFNGQDPDNPDGNQIPFPSNAQFRNDRGDGKNVFGHDLTAPVSTTIGYQAPDISTPWGQLSDSECQTIREWFSVMKDANSNIITLLDTLSNKYLGTTGSSNGSWDNTIGEYTGGIFTGCRTSANHEIWERILALTDIYYREEEGLNFNIKTWSLPGSKMSYCYFENDGRRYYDAGHTKLANYLAKFTSSLTNVERSWVDVLREFNYRITHDTLWPGRVDGVGAYCMRRQFVLNSCGRMKDALPYSSNITKNYDYNVIASAYDSTHKNATDMYDSSASPAFRNFIEAARKNMANGVIDVETTDSQNTYSMRLFYEGLLKYCKETGVEIVTKSEAFDICFNHSIENGNLLYNKELRNTAKEFMPTANVPTNPDGYTEGCSVEYDSDNTPILSTTAAVTYCHYGIPNGDIKYSADVKGSGTITVYAIKNDSNFDFSNLTEIGSVQINSADSFVAKNISFNIPNNSMQAYEQVFEGYGNKIIGIRIVYSSGLKVKNIKLLKE